MALVTGANRGIGAATVDAFVATGAARVYTCMRETNQDVHGNARVVPIRLNVTDDSLVVRAAHSSDARQLPTVACGVAS